MKEVVLQHKDGLGRVVREDVARMPEAADVKAVRVGELAPDCFGRMSMVTRVDNVTKSDRCVIVHYFTKMGPGDNAQNGCGVSNMMRAGELMRSAGLTALLCSAECDMLEEMMRGGDLTSEQQVYELMRKSESRRFNPYPNGRWS